MKKDKTQIYFNIIEFMLGITVNNDLIVGTKWWGKLFCKMAVRQNEFIEVGSNQYKLNK